MLIGSSNELLSILIYIIIIYIKIEFFWTILQICPLCKVSTLRTHSSRQVLIESKIGSEDGPGICCLSCYFSFTADSELNSYNSFIIRWVLTTFLLKFDLPLHIPSQLSKYKQLLNLEFPWPIQFWKSTKDETVLHFNNFFN